MINRILLVVLISFCSCNKDFLDVSNELAEEQTLEKIFSTPSSVRKWHRNIYSGVPNTMNFFWITVINTRRTPNPWIWIADEFVGRHRSYFPYTRALEPQADNANFGRWDLYELIRQANIFLERAVEIPKTGSADFLGVTELEELKAHARLMRAYYHYLLFELYGPVPIMDFVVDAAADDLDFARNSVDEVVDFIYNELTDILPQLGNPLPPNQIERVALPTKGTALAIRARLLVYAASPLFNGGYAEAVALRDKEGKQLFPARDPQKWNRALTALQEFIDYANSGHYQLYKVYKEDGSYDPDLSLYELHMKYNKEMILVRADDQGVNPSSGPVGNIDTHNKPRVALGSATTGDSGLLQELLDDFYMNDGLKIDESPKYSEVGYSVAGEDLTGRTEPGTFRMFVNREPRFYQTVFYNGRKWHIGNQVVWFNKGGNSDNSGSAPFTGHMLYKRTSRKVYRQSPHPNSEYRPIIVHRLAEFYLLYAEVLNEVNPNDPRIIEYVDKVRERAGIPLLAAIKPHIIGNQSLQREAIRHEMRIELATEGQRYFDIKRWMIAENPAGKGGLGGKFTGMDMNAPTLDGFYKRTVLQTRTFHRKEYLFPLPQQEMLMSRKLVQNPGYETIRTGD